MMRILIIHNIMWSHYKATVFSELHKQTKKEGLNILVLQTALTGSGQKALSAVDKSIHRYPFELLFDSSFETTTVWERIKKYRYWIKQFKPDIIILPGYIDKAVWILTAMLIFNKIKFIQSSDSTYFDHKRFWLKEQIKYLLLCRAELVFCYGSSQKTYLRSLGIPDRKIWVRVQATNNDRILEKYYEYKAAEEASEKGSAIKFLFVGRFSSEKNVSTLIQAFKLLPNNTQLSLVGEGPEKAGLVELVKKLGLSGRVVFQGSTDWVGVVKFYYYSHVLVLPSLSEIWGLVVNEAMLCHLPVIVSSRCGASGDLVVDGVNGFSFDPENVQELAEKMYYFVDHPEEIERMGSNSAEIISDFTPQKAAGQMTQGIMKVLRSNK
ncbi:glycosyltransferase family 4 protein [Neolewinella lacunae]|uniref:Glycosyltransferase family 4 protein n=1 Tax=Neolewinella lacunae TaxID=1517758 RepID=A0A923PKD3_9BACT|nr:glycosyltransferase family 4 protein [Neolewinella lacunae]MBC6994160.1 glycosyltransferase family 4 protein [Neolewinella lacunae]MDN3636691.1 glycosyltransferase family 4 protein [Neolewinella lacunae]